LNSQLNNLIEIDSSERTKEILLKVAKWAVGVSGAFALLFFILSFTDIPYHAYHWLGTSNSKLTKKPDVIVLLAGNGMPSPDGLIKAYYTAEAANEFKEAEIIIALPYGETDSLGELQLMKHELMMRGVDSSRIQFEPNGFNTHSQAENIAAKYEERKNKLAVLLITTPEHMYRSVETFLKAGFANAGGIPAFEKPIDEEKIKDNERTSDTRVKNPAFRYNMWSYMNYELLVLREYFAIAYYKTKGWI